MTPAAAETTRQVLGFVLDQLLRLLHPVMPFVTEELWTALTGEDSVMVSAWPTFAFADRAAEAEISSMMRLVTEIRRFRSDQGLRPSQRVAARLAGIEATPLAGHEARIRSLLRLEPGCRRLHRVGVDRGRGHHGRTRRGRRHRRRGRAPPDGEGSRGGPSRGRSRRSGSWPTPTSPPRRPPRWWTRPASASRRPRPTSPAWSSASRCCPGGRPPEPPAHGGLPAPSPGPPGARK